MSDDKKTVIVTTIVLFVCIIISQIFPLLEHAGNHYPNGDYIVRITRTGSKYHFASCSYLHSSSIKITLEEAVSRGYGACSRCDPPSYISVEHYRHAKANQDYIFNIIRAITVSILPAFLSLLISTLLLMLPRKFISWFDDYLPDWIFQASAGITYITILIRAIDEFIIW